MVKKLIDALHIVIAALAASYGYRLH